MAGTKKTKKTSKKKTRKKKTEKKKEEVIMTFEDFSVGQKAWFKTTAGGIGYGKIKRFYLKNREGPVIQYEDEINGGTRHCLVSESSFKEPKGGARKLMSALKAQARAEKKVKNGKK